MLNNIICRLIKKREVTFGDIIHHMGFYAIIYAELVMIICLIPVVEAIYHPQSFELVAFGSPVITIFIIIPGFIIYSFKYILEKVGLYDIIIKMQIAGCPKNYEVIETEMNTASNIKEKIIWILGSVIFLLTIILFAEMIYFDVPIEPI